MHAYNKTIEPLDYARIPGITFVDGMRTRLAGIPYPWGHDHRTWEYGLVLNALLENRAQTVLDVGGGGSIFLSAAVLSGLDLLTVDPADDGPSIQGQEERLGITLHWAQQDFFEFRDVRLFDAVTCISVIEHVEKDTAFFDRLLSYVAPWGLLCLTTDFHPSGQAVFGGHIRTYNEEKLLDLIHLAYRQGFEVFGLPPNYAQFTQQIFNLYSFGSLIMRRVE